MNTDKDLVKKIEEIKQQSKDPLFVDLMDCIKYLAESNFYDDFKTPLSMPKVTLVAHLDKCADIGKSVPDRNRVLNLIESVKEGNYDQ